VDVTETATRRCAGCGAALGADDSFCEQCGARAGNDRDVATNDRAGDRVEVDLVGIAGVSDRGRVHRRNEDAFAIEAPGERSAVAVVCDGISSASAGDMAAQTAARVAAAALSAAAREQPSADGRSAVGEAVRAAHAAVAEVPWTTRVGRAVPSCTLVCALWRGAEIVIGSVGDSRAYWTDVTGTRQLTVDDSWAEEQVAEGLMSAAEAMRDPRSHSITHWIGADAPDRPARVVTLTPERPGRLLLCSDGLWNYVASDPALHHLIGLLPPETSAAALARALTDVALHRGGRDNITVVVIDVDPS
jgi:serine/threonine protein phosphatase PrpC